MTPPPPTPGRGPALSRRDLLRWGATAGGGLALAGLLAGCAPTSTAKVASGAVDLSFWTHDPGYEKFFTKALPLAAKKSPFTYKLDITTIAAGDIPTKLIAQAVANTGTPDVVGLEIGAFCRMLRGDIASQLLTDLGPSVASQKDDLIAARLTPFSKNDHLYALDSDTPLCVYYHREDQFAALGLPTDFETWEELSSIGAKLHKDKGASIHAVAVTDPGGAIQNYQILLLQRGGDLWDEDGGLSIETPEAEQTLAFLADGIQSGAIATVADMYGPSLQAGLKNNSILGVDMPSWYASYGIKPNVPEQTGKWRVRKLPVFKDGGGATSVGGGTGFAALRNKPLSKAGVDLVLATYLDKDQQVKRYEDLGYLPTLRSVYDDPRLAALQDPYFGNQQLFGVYKSIIDDVPSQHQSADAAILQTVLSGYLIKAYKGQLTPKQALSAAASDFRGQTRA
ncbi:ABC transporter substrate-binding protein [Curtobacterium sp. RRHDQ10]|uniref:ABC transporter substrate-binding protein n=1 Tax=Curtobacterium phyllosphaerae TaxID=3413379 RepID=UPI003BF3D4DC